MENFFARYKNPLVLMAVLFVQIVALATQVKRPEGNRAGGSGSTRLIRVWTVTTITPFERALVATGHFFRSTWRDYIDLHDVRRQNLRLEQELAELRLEQARLKASADESQRLRALLDFKERYVGETIAAQVIGNSGSDSFRAVTIDKGSHAGIQPDMAVITADGIVGKVKEVFPFSSVVLLINDRESGAGVILQNSRLHGILRGVGPGELMINGVMSDEKVDVGEAVVTSGGDRVFPKGLPVGTVISHGNDAELGPFLAIKIKPAANLDRLEEVLVVTRIAADAPVVTSDPHRTADILSQRLPSVAKPAENPGNNASVAGSNAGAGPPAGNKAVAGQAVPSPAPVKKATNTSPATGSTGAVPPAGNGTVAGSALPSPTPLKKTMNASPATGSTGAVAPAGNRTVVGSALPSPTPVKKKKPSLPSSPEGGSQASPAVTPPAESSQPDSADKPKPKPSPAANGEKPPR